MGATSLEIRLFGSPEVTLEGRPVEVDTRKAIAMLAYLAIEGSADRDTLANLFWADSSPDRARATLRRTLSALRAGVGNDVIGADRNRVRLDSQHRTDVDEFLASIAETGSHGHNPSDVCDRCVASLEIATSLYRGDFLGAFSVRDAPEFEDWARSLTESYRLKAGEAYRRLAYARAAGGEYPAAIAAANHWIALDELHEPAHRLAMLLNAWAGDRPGAIQAYRECVGTLDRELAVAPLAETTELFEAIMDEDIPPAPGMPRPIKAHQSGTPATRVEMIDRDWAILALEGTLRMSSRDSQICILTGDSWMGKTRLLDHGHDFARSLGHNVSAGVAFRAEAHLPYGVTIQLIDALVPFVERGPDDLPDWALSELTRLVPRLSRGTETPDNGQLGQLRIRDAFLTLVEAAAAGRPLMISVDDAQWIDPASADLLGYVGRRRSDLRLLLVISTRDPDALPPGLRDLVDAGDQSIELRPLTPDDLSAGYGDRDLEALIRATGGIPLLVKEALDTGVVAADSSSVARYIDSRRGRLSELARQVLAAAAVLDGLCDAALLREVSGRTEEEVVDAVEELVASGLLHEQDDMKLTFTLDVVERVTYDSTSPIRRRLLHKRAAEALESRSRSRMDARMATATAGHLRLAGSEDAPDWYRLAGDLARGVYANREAVGAYEAAIALGHADVGSLRLALGEIAITIGDYDTATRELQAAASQSQGATLALVEHRIGDLNRLIGRFDLAEESFNRAVKSHPRLSELYADWALLRHRVGDNAGAVGLADRAVAAADTASEKARALNVLGLVTSDPEQAMSHIDLALEITEETDPARMAALNNKAHLLAESGTDADAIALVNEAIDIAARAGYRHHQAALLNHLADLHHRAGRHDDTEQALTDAVTIFADIDSGDWRPEVWLLRQW
jgi:DNA-binding SARP family transcriptional activator/Tfp pilus assembly protein PilF